MALASRPRKSADGSVRNVTSRSTTSARASRASSSPARNATGASPSAANVTWRSTSKPDHRASAATNIAASMTRARPNESTIRAVIGRGPPRRRATSSAAPASRSAAIAASWIRSTASAAGLTATVRTFSGSAPSRILTSCRTVAAAYAATTSARSTQLRSRPVGNARNTCRNIAAGSRSARLPAVCSTGLCDHCPVVNAMTSATATMSGPSRLAGRRHPARRPLIRYGTVIQLTSTACRAGRTSVSLATASAIVAATAAAPSVATLLSSQRWVTLPIHGHMAAWVRAGCDRRGQRAAARRRVPSPGRRRHGGGGQVHDGRGTPALRPRLTKLIRDNGGRRRTPTKACEPPSICANTIRAWGCWCSRSTRSWGWPRSC